MRIGIDAEMFAYQNRTGIPNSVEEVLKCWMEDHPEHEYYLFAPKPIKLFNKYPSNWRVFEQRRLPADRLWRMIELPLLIKKNKIDTFWGTNYTLPFSVKNTRYVLTVYDLAWFLFDGIGEKRNTKMLKRKLPVSIKRADEIIAISQATKDDVVRIYGVQKEKVTVSYCGGITEKNESLQSESIRDEVRREKSFFLFVSTIEPRKNVLTIVKAFESYLDNVDNGEELILAGGKGWNCEAIYAAIEKSRYSDRMITLGFVSNREKDYLMKNALAFLYPSLYEGFGIPILEAFSYGLPVITTRISSIPEVAGDAALYIDDPYDFQSLAQKMSEAVCYTDNERDRLKEAMKARIGLFSWKKNAEEVLTIINSCNKKRR